MFVEKKAYALTSELSENNKIYRMENKLASTPFKLNQTLLDYITGEGSKHNLLIDVDTEHKFADYFVALRCPAKQQKKKFYFVIYR